MNNFDEFDNSKPNKKNKKKFVKKTIDEDQRDQAKLNKFFKQKRKALLEEDADWENWKEDYR